MKLKSLLAALSLLVSGVVISQPYNVVKLNTFGFFSSNLSLGYERDFSDRAGANLQLGYIYGNDFFRTILSRQDNIDLGSVGISIGKFKGFTMQPEIRLYSKKHEGAPVGAYFAPYFKFTTARSRGLFTFDPFRDDATMVGTFASPLNLTMKYQHIGFGLKLGRQWLIQDQVALDLFWFGPRIYAQNKYTFEVSGQLVQGPNTNFTYTDVQGDFDNVTGEFQDIPVVGGLVNFDQEINGNSFTATIKHPIFIFPWNFGFSVGYAF